jgi:hypothetical protein
MVFSFFIELKGKTQFRFKLLIKTRITWDITDDKSEIIKRFDR